ncbi:MAG: DNA-3-methyladenine glycosylase [Candidatus Nanohaloarchaea archaeon]
MEEYSIEAENFDLEETLTCGQTFSWHRTSGDLYDEGSNRFYTFRRGKPLIVEQVDGRLTAETPLDKKEVKNALGLHHDLEEVFSTFPQDEKLSEAREELWGLRIVQDEFFPTLIAYLLSPQMRIPRIKKMYNKIARKYGETVSIDGEKLLRFPARKELSQATEQELRDLGTGYRAKYIVETLKILEEKKMEPENLREMDYHDAKKELKKLYGVGDKVADCVLLFSLGFYEAYPIDTWAEKALKTHYSDLHSDDYTELSENMRNYFGEYSGYAQEYIFHAARQGHIEVS